MATIRKGGNVLFIILIIGHTLFSLSSGTRNGIRSKTTDRSHDHLSPDSGFTDYGDNQDNQNPEVPVVTSGSDVNPYGTPFQNVGGNQRIERRSVTSRSRYGNGGNIYDSYGFDKPTSTNTGAGNTNQDYASNKRSNFGPVINSYGNPVQYQNVAVPNPTEFNPNYYPSPRYGRNIFSGSIYDRYNNFNNYQDNEPDIRDRRAVCYDTGSFRDPTYCCSGVTGRIGNAGNDECCFPQGTSCTNAPDKCCFNQVCVSIGNPAAGIYVCDQSDDNIEADMGDESFDTMTNPDEDADTQTDPLQKRNRVPQKPASVPRALHAPVPTTTRTTTTTTATELQKRNRGPQKPALVQRDLAAPVPTKTTATSPTTTTATSTNQLRKRNRAPQRPAPVSRSLAAPVPTTTTASPTKTTTATESPIPTITTIASPTTTTATTTTAAIEVVTTPAPTLDDSTVTDDTMPLANPTVPADSTTTVDPTLPAEATSPVDPMDLVDQLDFADHTNPTDQMNSVDETDSKDSNVSGPTDEIITPSFQKRDIRRKSESDPLINMPMANPESDSIVSRNLKRNSGYQIDEIMDSDWGNSYGTQVGDNDSIVIDYVDYVPVN